MTPPFARVSDGSWRLPALIVALQMAAATALAMRDLALRLPLDQWRAALVDPKIDDTGQMLVHFTVMPRIAVAILCGAGLGLAGAVCQQVLRNPLAEPTTLGVSAGASLALSAAGLWAPWLLAYGLERVALAGSAAAIPFVFGLAWNRALSPVSRQADLGAALRGGAGLLRLTDGLVLLIPTGYREISTGAATALLGASMLLVLLPRRAPELHGRAGGARRVLWRGDGRDSGAVRGARALARGSGRGRRGRSSRCCSASCCWGARPPSARSGCSSPP